jgi:cell division GTPase FtsZ
MAEQKFGFIGTGHAGSRFVDTLLLISQNLYPSICFNTALTDLQKLKFVPDNNRIHIKLPDNIDGAGKDPELGRKAVINNEEKIRQKIKQEFSDTKMIYLVYSSGGGTGRGSSKEIMRILNDLEYDFSIIVIEPFDNEGYQPTINAFTAFKEISEAYNEFDKCKNATLLDNQMLSEREDFKNLSAEDFYISANKLIAQSFHLFNLSTTKKGIENFDARDYIKCLSAKGFMTLGTLKFNKREIQNNSIFIDKLNINLKKNLFTNGLDLKSATHAAVILFVPEDIIEKIDREVLFSPFNEMSKILDGATIYKGIYPSRNEEVKIYCLISGMDFPRDKIKKLGETAKDLHNKTKLKIQKLKKTDDFDLDSDTNLVEKDKDLQDLDFNFN